MPELATWSDLPVEILDQILALCDTKTLLNLSYLNIQLNTLAPEALFKRESVTNPKQGYIVSRLAAPEIVPALNVALWLKNLPHVTYYLNPDVKRLFAEVRGLERLVGRVRANDRLDLYFSSVDRWFADLGSGRMSGEQMWVDPVVWRSTFVRLLEMALRQGCRSMRVEGAHRMDRFYVDRKSGKALLSVPPSPSAGSTSSISSRLAEATPTSVSSIPTRASIKKRLSRWLRKRLGLKVPSRQPLTTGNLITPTPTIQVTPPQEPEPTRPETDPTKVVLPCDNVLKQTSFTVAKPCLRSLNIRSSMMLQPLFFNDTRNLIRAHCHAIETLELVSIKAPRSVWENFFQSLHLPVLKHFVYLYDTLIVEDPLVTPTLLLEFFKRHPSISIIELYGVNVGDHDKSIEIEFPKIDADDELLPNLDQLDAHPKVVSWLLQQPKACPKLTFVCLTSEYLASRLSTTLPNLNPYKSFDAGLLTLASLLIPDAPSPPEEGYVPTSGNIRPINLQLKFSTENMLLEWLLSHTTLAHSYNNPTHPPNPSSPTPQQSVLHLLTNVRKVTISAHYHTRFEIEHKQVLPRFLGILPNLKELELVELPYPEEVRDDMFVEDVRRFVKGLERFVIGRNVVWDVDGFEGSIVDESWESTGG
jgi:hypothetical protein